MKLPLPGIASAIDRVIRGEGFRLSIPAAQLQAFEEQGKLDESADNGREVSYNSEDDKKTRTAYLLRSPHHGTNDGAAPLRPSFNPRVRPPNP